jgi:hypothetical protein
LTKLKDARIVIKPSLIVKIILFAEESNLPDLTGDLTHRFGFELDLLILDRDGVIDG